MSDVEGFNNSIDNIKEKITFFKDKNHKSKKIIKNLVLTKIRKSFGTLFIIATTSSSITLSLTGIGLIVIAISTGIARALAISNKVYYEIVMQKYSEHKDNIKSQRDQQTIKSTDKFYRKSLQNNMIDKSEKNSMYYFYKISG